MCRAQCRYAEVRLYAGWNYTFDQGVEVGAVLTLKYMPAIYREHGWGTDFEVSLGFQ